MKDYEICPYCNADLKSSLMFVERGCTNYLYYIKIGATWQIDDELDGQDPLKTEYACRRCERDLPKEYQKYFEEHIYD